MKKTSLIYILSSVFLITHLNAQMGRGTPPKLNAIKKAGLVTYSPEEVVKKLKITEEATKTEVEHAIGVYNVAIDTLLEEHEPTWD